MSLMTAADFEARYRADPDPWGYTHERLRARQVRGDAPGLRPRAVRLRARAGWLDRRVQRAARAALRAARDHRRRPDRGRGRARAARPLPPGRVDPRRDPGGGPRSARYDLVVASEILYYLDRRGSSRRTLAAARAHDAAGGPPGRRPLAPGRTRASARRGGGARDPPRAAVARPDRVRGDRRLPARRLGAPMSERFELLVVGGGPAGLSAARSYREAGGDGPVAIVTDEHRMPYQRPPLTKELLRGESTEDDLPIEEEAWLAEQEVALITRPRGGARPRRAPDRRALRRARARATAAACWPPAPSRPGCRSRAPTIPRSRVLRSLDHVRELQLRLATRRRRGRDRVGLHRLRDRRLAADARSRA